MECEEIERTFPSSFRLVPHNVSGIPATLWLTMWTECEEFVSLNEDPYCHYGYFIQHCFVAAKLAVPNLKRINLFEITFLKAIGNSCCHST